MSHLIVAISHQAFELSQALGDFSLDFE